jgi:hypothetical protein
MFMKKLKYYFIDKICCLKTPAIGNLIAFDLNLSSENLLPDLSSRFADIWTAAIHALVSNDTYCEIIGGHSVVLSTHNFGCHISWGA